jgi:hypothetical protein
MEDYMDNKRRSLLVGMMAVASGVAAGSTAYQGKKKVHGNVTKTSAEENKTMSKLDKSALDLKYDLSFPFNHQGSSYIDKLNNI